MTIIQVGSGGESRNQVQRVPEDVEKRVERMLQDIDRHLHLQWHDLFQRYYIANKWHDQDPRWELHRQGEVGDPYDILGWFTSDLDSAEDRVLEFLGRMDQTRETWKQRMKASIEHNKKVQEDLRKQGVEEMTEALEYNRKRIFSEPVKRGVVFDANGQIIQR